MTEFSELFPAMVWGDKLENVFFIEVLDLALCAEWNVLVDFHVREALYQRSANRHDDRILVKHFWRMYLHYL